VRVQTLSRRATVALVVLGTIAATGISAATNGSGPLGPAGVFFVLVLFLTVSGGPAAGFAATGLGVVILGVAFTEDARGVADLLAFGVTSVLITLVVSRLVEVRDTAENARAQVDAMVRNAPVGMAFVDRDLRYVQINDALAAMNGRTVEEMLGRRVDEPDYVRDTDVPELIRTVLQRGETFLDVPWHRNDVHVVAGYYPVRGADGAITGAGIVVRETSAEHQRDVLFDRVTRLQELSASLSATGTVGEVVDTAVRAIHHAVGARAASFCLVDGDAMHVAGSIGYSDEVIAGWQDFSLDEDVPIADAVRRGEAVLCSDRDAVLRRYPHLGSSLWAESSALAAFPLRGESSIIGAIGISFQGDHTFDRDQTSFLRAAVSQVATAYERAAAFEAEREARHAAEEANARLGYLVEATAVLSQSLDPETTMQRLAELAVPTLSDWCAVHIVEDGFAQPVAMASEDPNATAMVRDLSERHPVPIDAPAGLGAVVRTGQPIVLRSVTMDAVRASTDESEVVDLLSRLRAIAILPMTYQGKVVGTVTLSNTTDRELTDADVQLATELAARAAQAVTNARLYTERTKVAETLQASLMPPSTPIIPGVDVATRFVAVADGLDVGGDFYDVFRLGTVDAPAGAWALVIGDVRGKGADAAAITGIARATIRATALDERSPSKMLQRLNQVLLAAAQDDRFASETSEPRFCTALVVTIAPVEGGADLTVAVGGHPLPYVVRGDGAIEQVGTPGGLIGVLAEPAIEDVHVRLGAGDSIVLFTDGVTERHKGTVFFDDGALAKVIADCAGLEADAAAAKIELATRTFVETESKDDLAIVVARVPLVTGSGPVARLVLPEGGRAPALARRFAAEALGELGADDAVAPAMLLTSELVTNAMVHGAAPISVEVHAVPSGVRVAVADHHPDLPAPRAASRDDEHGRGRLLVEAIAAAWGVDAHPPGKSVWFELPA
jgi:serine phosphatase RsbU (regulator of sigma subunit)/PAS domain-containing protein/anti-sigma regulatory factor (Ser/Thr protein kinase)